MAEQLFASFILDRSQCLEIAISAEDVTEATPISWPIQPLPASVSFLEGVMHLRDAVIPVVNLKKRLGLPDVTYDRDAKIAVVGLGCHRVGLLFDDIHEVLRVEDTLMHPVSAAFQSADPVISDLIVLNNERRTIEVLDLKKIFHDTSLFADGGNAVSQSASLQRKRTYSRYVVFSSNGQQYGVSVDHSREITFPAAIDPMFKNGCLEGALQLRGHTIPVLNASVLLKKINQDTEKYFETTRVLVMSAGELIFGMIVDEVLEILTIVNEDIMLMPSRSEQAVLGVYEPTEGRNVMLLDVANLIAAHSELLQSMARINTEEEEHTQHALVEKSRHLITENCYLIFSIGKYFAIELKDIQEILERNVLMSIPDVSGFDSEVLNLRGQIVPVVDLRKFYRFSLREEEGKNFKLIICRHGARVVALQVDAIVTIYKQEQFYETPSLNPQLQDKHDTLDRLIEFVNESQLKEHVLVINIANLIGCYLQQDQRLSGLSVGGEVSNQNDVTTETEQRRQ